MKANEIKWERKTSRDVSPLEYESKIINEFNNIYKFIDYSISNSNEWDGRVTKVNYLCYIHGKQCSSIGSILSGRKCKECGYNSMKSKQRKSKDAFIDECNNIHNGKYDYSHILYINDTTKVEVLCLKHNHIFLITPTHHRRGQGCNLCKRECLRLKNSSNTDQFIIKCQLVHPDKFKYDKVVYINNRTKVNIYCNNHDDYFTITPNKILSGGGCQKCAMHGFNKNKPSYFYIQQLVLDEKVYYKFGITNNSPELRMNQQNRVSYCSHTLIKSLYYENGTIPLMIEREIKNTIICGALTKYQFSDGFTETIHNNQLIDVLNIINKYEGKYNE